MENSRQNFTTRQSMAAPDVEFFHYCDNELTDVEYHNHDFYEIYFFISGRVTYIVEGKQYQLRQGDILLINNKELHKPVIGSDTIYERMVIWVDPAFIARHSTADCNLARCFEDSARKRHNLLRLDSDIMNSVKLIFLKFEKALSSTSLGSSILRDVYLTELLVFLNRAYDDAPQKESDNDILYNEKISNVIKFINDNLSIDLSLESISKRFYLSKYHLLREFKKHAGYSIYHYIQQKRLIMARSLLKEGMSVTEVCAACGFGNYSNFIRTFKKYYGVPPGKYGKTGL